jgi:hypothetical protein
MKEPSAGSRPKLFRMALTLWSGVGLVALIAPWPYTVGALLFATFLHFAALDGDTETRQYARRKS